jgi:hypothetical protein
MVPTPFGGRNHRAIFLAINDAAYNSLKRYSSKNAHSGALVLIRF